MNATPLQATGFEAGDSILGLSGDTHADWLAAFGRVGPWTCVAASAAGHMHLREGTPRDDAYAIRSVGPWLAVAVADGAGSRPNSRYGASYAVASLCEHMIRLTQGIAGEPPPAETNAATPPETAQPKPSWGRKRLQRLRHVEPFQQPRRDPTSAQNMPEVQRMPGFTESPNTLVGDEASLAWGTLAWRRECSAGADASEAPDLGECVRDAFRVTRAGVDIYAAQRGMAVSEMHCTLLGVLLDTRTGAMGVGQIGDGLISCLHPGLGARPLVEPPTTGNVGETYVLTQPNWQKYLAVRSLGPEETAGICAVYIMTDGVADDCTHPPPDGIFDRWSHDVERELRGASAASAASVKLVRWLATYEARGSWDDRTLAVLMRDTGQAAAPEGDEFTPNE